MDDKYLLDRLIAIARENERHTLLIEELDEALQAAKDKIAILESVELLSELKGIQNAPDTKNGV